MEKTSKTPSPTPWTAPLAFFERGAEELAKMQAQSAVQAINDWIRTTTGGDPDAIRSGYALDGTPLPGSGLSLDGVRGTARRRRDGGRVEPGVAERALGPDRRVAGADFRDTLRHVQFSATVEDTEEQDSAFLKLIQKAIHPATHHSPFRSLMTAVSFRTLIEVDRRQLSARRAMIASSFERRSASYAPSSGRDVPFALLKAA